MYIGVDLSDMNNIDGKECWYMSSDKYCTSAVTNIENVFEKRGLRFPPKCVIPMSRVYCTDMDVTGYLKADVIQR